MTNIDPAIVEALVVPVHMPRNPRSEVWEPDDLDERRTEWVCDGCMALVTRSEIGDMCDGEHVICVRCLGPLVGAP